MFSVLLGVYLEWSFLDPNSVFNFFAKWIVYYCQILIQPLHLWEILFPLIYFQSLCVKYTNSIFRSFFKSAFIASAF